MKRRVDDLRGPLLDAAVAHALGTPHTSTSKACFVHQGADSRIFAPSTRWDDGGPIIEQARLELWFVPGMGHAPGHWAAGERYGFGSGIHAVGAVGLTPLIAAMRAFLAMKVGVEVELP